MTTAAALIRAVDRASSARLHYFFRRAWPLIEPSTPYVDNWHIGWIAEHLAAVQAGEIRKLIINIPPGGSKSSLVSVAFNAWVWTRDPGAAFMCASFDVGLTTRDAGKVRMIVESEWYQSLWGDRVRIDRNQGMRDYRILDARGRVTGGWRYSTSMDGKATGNHPDYKLFDDPTKPKNITTEALEATWARYQDTFESRGRDRSTVRTVVIMQRIAQLDLTGRLLERDPEFVHLFIPLEFNSKRVCVTPLGRDPRTRDGESFFIERFPPEAVKATYLLDAQIKSAQYEQDPTPPGGNIYAPTDIAREWDEIPDGGEWCISVDAAFKDEATSDNVVMQVWCMYEARLYLIDQVCGRMDFPTTVETFIALCGRYPQAWIKLVEEKANGAAILAVLRGAVLGLEPVNPKDSKAARAKATVPLFRVGAVLLPPAHRAPWVHEYRAELIAFPRGAHDDQVDATTQAVNWLAPRAGLDYGGTLDGLEKLQRMMGGDL